MEFYFPTRVITGRGCVQKNADRLRAFGKRCLIVTGRTSAKKCGALDDVKFVLDSVNTEYEIFDKITQNPMYTDCRAGADAARSFGADFIIGIGGGSPLDAGKAIAFLASNPEAGESEIHSQRFENPPLPFVAVGTTAGTGSEVTQVSVITGTDGRKRSYRSDSAFPALALGDPKYTEFMPQSVTRSTAADALCHCIESYFNNTATEFSRLYALYGAKLITGVFSQFPKDGNLSEYQRDTLYRASLFGGIAISITGTCIPHALGYFLTESHGIPHGTACAFWLPYFIEHNLNFAPELSSRFFEVVKMTPQELIALVKRIAPPMDAAVSAQELETLKPRWKNNGSLLKAIGGIDNIYIENLLKQAFIKGEERK